MKINERELLAWRMRGLHLYERAPSSNVVSDLIGLQAQFANNAKMALRIRASDFDPARWSDGLVKIWSFRHTLHDVPIDEVGLHLSARGRMESWDNRWGIDAKRASNHAARLMVMLGEGVDTRAALKARFCRAGITKDELSRIFHGWGGLFYEMNQRGMIAYHPDTEKRFVPLERVEWIDTQPALALMTHRYFKAYGPATLKDLMIFTGFRAGDIRQVLASDPPPLKEVKFKNQTLYYLGDPPDDLNLPACRFLTGFDAMIMGYADRSFIIDPDDKKHIVTLSGIVFPTVLIGGKIRARWKLTGDELTITAFRPLSKTQMRAVETAARAAFYLRRADAKKLTIVFEVGA